MALAAHRWMTTARNAPRVGAALDAAHSRLPVEPHLLDDVHRIPEPAQRRSIRRRAVLAP